MKTKYIIRFWCDIEIFDLPDFNKKLIKSKQEILYHGSMDA